jgi:phosphonate transport system substrate-binding protein
MNGRIHRIALMLMLGSLLVASACGGSPGDDTPAGATGRDAWPETIQYGLLPTDDVDDLVAIYTPLEEYMENCLDHPFKLYTATNYTAMIEAMRTGNIHISRFGPFSYILAHERAGAEALVIAVEDANEPTYRSQIVTLKSYGFDSIEDLEGKKFAFVDPTSSSGHLYPRAMVIEEVGIENDEVEDWFGEVVFAGNHEASILSVLNGDVDAGAIAGNSGVWEGEMDDHPKIDEFTVLAESEDIPLTTEAIRNDLPQDLKDAILSCYEGVADEPSLAEFREEGGLGEGYIKTSDSAYDVVRDVAEHLEMSPKELLED